LSWNHTKHINVPCGEIADIFHVKGSGTVHVVITGLVVHRVTTGP